MANTLQFDAVVNVAQLNKLLDDLRSGAEGAAKAINAALSGTVTKKLVLEEVVDSKGQKQLVAVEKERLSIADQIVAKQRQLRATQAGSVTSLRQQVNSLKQARDSAARYETSVNAIGGSIRRQRAEWSTLNAQVSQVSRQLAVASASGFWDRIKVATRSQGLINISQGLVGLTQGFQAASILAGQFLGAINSVVDASAKLQSFALSFKAIGAGAAGGITGLQESSRIALGLGVDLNTVQEGFKQLAPVILNTGGTLGDVSSVVEALSSRFAAFGISGDRARRVMNGVIQAFSKGKLQAEELTQQISEADPAFKTDLAAALGASRDSLGELGKEIDGTVPGLEKLVKAGKITGEVLLKVLPQLSKSALLYGKLGSSAGSAVDALEGGNATIDQVRANLQTLNDLSLREVALSSEPLINALLRLQAVVTDTFTRIARGDGIDAISSVAAKAVEVITKLADGFFVLAEGAIGIVGALKPVLDLVLAIAEIPGVAQVAGIALIGKLLGPLKLLEGRVASTSAAWRGFKNILSGAFGGGQKAIGEVSAALAGVGSSLDAGTFASNVIDDDDVRTIQKGSEATATYAERQKALTSSKALLIRASLDTNNQLKLEGENLKRLTEARDRAAKSGDQPLVRDAQLSTFNTQIEESTNKIKNLQNTQAQLVTQSGAVNSAIKNSGAAMSGFGARAAQARAGVAGFGTTLVNVGKGAFKAFGSGLTSILALLDPLLVIMIAAGVGARLYADGTKEATEATKRFAEQNNVLQAAIDDINPGLGAAKTQSTALGRAWESLSVSTVRLVDATSSAFEGLAKFGEVLTGGIRAAVAGLSDGFVNLAGSIALVSGATAAGALLGIAGGPAGIAVLATVGAIVGVVAALGLGSSRSAVDLAKLEKELKAVDEGSQATVVTVKGLVTALEGLQRDQTGNFSRSDATKIAEGYSAIQAAVIKTKAEIDRLTAAQQANADKDELARRRQVALRIKANELLEQGATGPEQRDTLANAAADAADPERRARNQELTRQLKEIRAEEKALGEQRTNQGQANSKLDTQLGALSDRYRELLADEKRAAEVAKVAAEANVLYANSSEEVNDAIKTLQADNETVEFTNPEDLARLDAGLNKIKDFQDLLKEISKTKIEVQIEIRGQDDKIADNIDGITLPKGPLRDANAQAREVATTLKNSGDEFARSAERWQAFAKAGSIDVNQAAAFTQRAGRTFLVDITKSAAELTDSYEDLLDNLNSATNSLNSLTLSKVEFFTPQELQEAAASINEKFNDITAEIGFTPVLKPGSEIDILKQKQEFIETREQAKKLTDTIGDISKALDVVVAVLTTIPGVLDLLKKKGVDISKISKGAADAIDGIGSKGTQGLARVGEVLGEITSNGQTTILFFDNLTGQTEQLSKAEFDAAVAADKLAASVKGAGKDAKGAEGKVGGLGTKIGQVFGEITANGQTQVPLLNKVTGKNEFLSKATYDRLAGERAVTKEIGYQNTALRKSQQLATSAGGNGQLRSPALPTGLGGGATGRGPDTGGVVFSPAGNQSEEEGNRRMREIAQRHGGEYTSVLADVIANGGAGFMPTAQLTGMQADIDRYKTALQTLAGAQDQNAQAQARFNQGLATGSPELLTLAGAAANAKDALAQANMEVEGSLPNYNAAIQSARDLGINLDSIPAPNQLADTGPIKTAQQTWNDYVDSVRQGRQEINQNKGGGEFDSGGLVQYRNSLNGLVDTQKQAVDGQQGVASAVSDTSPALNTLATAYSGVQSAASIASDSLGASIPQYDAAKQLAQSLGTSLNSIPSPDRWADPAPVDAAKQSWVSYASAVTQANSGLSTLPDVPPPATPSLTPLEAFNRQAIDILSQGTRAWEEYGTDVSASLSSISGVALSDPLSGASDSAQTVEGSLGGAVGSSGSISTNLGAAATNAESISSAIRNLDGFTANVKVNQVPGRWAGGPVAAGQEVTVNELGQEGFLSRTGSLSAINVPANATWRPPASGTVIPANVWKQIKAPTGVVRPSEADAIRSVSRVRGGGDDVSRISRLVEATLLRNDPSGGVGELAAVQAQQAIEIGKLGRAVDNLASKKWNVNVGVTPASSAGYLKVLNSRL